MALHLQIKLLYLLKTKRANFRAIFHTIKCRLALQYFWNFKAFNIMALFLGEKNQFGPTCTTQSIFGTDYNYCERKINITMGRIMKSLQQIEYNRQLNLTKKKFQVRQIIMTQKKYNFKHDFVKLSIKRNLDLRFFSLCYELPKIGRNKPPEAQIIKWTISISKFENNLSDGSKNHEKRIILRW